MAQGSSRTSPSTSTRPASRLAQLSEPPTSVGATCQACNGQGIAADGVYGAGTEDAVAAVQAGLGLEVDGIYGPQTRVAMSWPTEPEAPADHAAEAGDGLEDDPEGVLDVDAGARPSSACISGG